ncbi:MAG: hypothetical protein AB7G34_09985 [Hyphomicrobiales bacterium]
MTWITFIAFALGVLAYVSLMLFLLWIGMRERASRWARVLGMPFGIYMLVSLLVPALWVPVALVGMTLRTQSFFFAPAHARFLVTAAAAEYKNIQHIRHGTVIALEVLYEVEVNGQKFSKVHAVYCTTYNGASLDKGFDPKMFRGAQIAVSKPVILETVGTEVLTADNRNQLCKSALPEKHFLRGDDLLLVHYVTDEKWSSGKKHTLWFEFTTTDEIRHAHVAVTKPQIISQRTVPARGEISLLDLPPFRALHDSGRQFTPLVPDPNQRKRGAYW